MRNDAQRFAAELRAVAAALRYIGFQVTFLEKVGAEGIAGSVGAGIIRDHVDVICEAIEEVALVFDEAKTG